MDELMVDLLYDELDPARSAKVAEHMGACARCSAEMGALQRTRAAFRDMSDLEPPASVSAILLHEAARHSPAAARTAADAPAPGLLDRLRAWFRPLVNHPGLAAAASLILVACVAGALFVRKGADMARPPALDQPAPAASAPAPATVPAADPAAPPAEPEPARLAHEPEESAAGLKDERKADGVVAGVVDGKQQTELEQAQVADDLDREGGARGDQAIEVRPADKELKEFDSAAASATVDARAREKNRAEEPGKKKLARREDPAATRTRGADPAAVTPDQSSDSAPAANAVTGAGPLAAERQLESAKGGEGGGGQGSQPTAAPESGRTRTDLAKSAGRADLAEQKLSPAEQGWLDTRQLRVGQLARKKACREAAELANDILERNPGYYARRVEPLKEMVPCRSYVGFEQKRRAARRVQKPASKNSSAPQKARAAPARDEAAEQTKQ
jgi:hypothetical protein